MFVGTRKTVTLSEVLVIKGGRRVPEIRMAISLTLPRRGEIMVAFGRFLTVIESQGNHEHNFGNHGYCGMTVNEGVIMRMITMRSTATLRLTAAVTVGVMSMRCLR